jgi:hypothetical protein
MDVDPADPAARFWERFGTGNASQRRIGIVALARRLPIDLWRLVEFGVVPDGARLKTAQLGSRRRNRTDHELFLAGWWRHP